MIGYPMGLPEWDPVRLLLENREGEMESVRMPSRSDAADAFPLSSVGWRCERRRR